MTIKTPEQVAEEMFREDISLGTEDKPVIVAAIRRDRAQRAERYRGLVEAYEAGAYEADRWPYEGVEFLGDALSEIVAEAETN